MTGNASFPSGFLGRVARVGRAGKHGDEGPPTPVRELLNSLHGTEPPGEEVLARLTAWYQLKDKNTAGGDSDPVANFHLRTRAPPAERPPWV